ncbi:MAG: SGNH/GDSL hydrolase family protein [Lachnospiraceae bacterium]|nr:SGNH/GDSL hydrolase family protein [Lachnospiraceae bacterium]
MEERQRNRQISILGDSISTFEGFDPPGYAVYYDEEMQEINGLRTVEDTWWMQVIHALDGRLCVNDSFSGSRVSGTSFPSALCEERLGNLRTQTADPDVILIYMGVNDYGYGVKISWEHMGLHFSQENKNYDHFEDAYDEMLRRLRELYPQARIVCGTLMCTAVKFRPGWGFPESIWGTELDDYNDTIRKAAARNGCLLADLAETGLRYETLDGSHPTLAGHEAIAGAWIRCLEELQLTD